MSDTKALQLKKLIARQAILDVELTELAISFKAIMDKGSALQAEYDSNNRDLLGFMDQIRKENAHDPVMRTFCDQFEDRYSQKANKN